MRPQGNCLHFPLPRRGAWHPLHKAHLAPHQRDQCPGMPVAGGDRSRGHPAPHLHVPSSPAKTVPATTDRSDKPHLNWAKVKNIPRTQLQARRGHQPPSAPGCRISACPAPPRPHGGASRNSLSAMTLSRFPSAPRGVSHSRAPKRKEKKPSSCSSRHSQITSDQPKLRNKGLGEDASLVPSAPDKINISQGPLSP